MVTRTLKTCLILIALLSLVILFGRGGMEPELALIPVLNTPALLLRTTVFFWFAPLALCVLIGIIFKVFGSKDAP